MQFLPKISIHTRSDIYDDVTPDVIAWNTGKSYGQPIGTFSLTLSTRPDNQGRTWFEKLSAQDFVIIRLSMGGGADFEVIMNGLIDRVSRDTNVNSGTGAVSETIRVDGSDLAKILSQFHVWYNPYQDGLSALIMGQVHLGPILEGLNPTTALDALLALVLDDDTHPKVKQIKALLKEEGKTPGINTFNPNNQGIDIDAGGPGIKEYLKFFASFPEKVHAHVAELTTFEGAIWNAFKKFANEPWNELFVDTGSASNAEDSTLPTDNKATHVILRPTPFKPEDFQKLVMHELTFADIQAPFSISKGDSDTYTYYFGRPILTTKFGDAKYTEVLVQPIIANESNQAISSFNRFGFRPLKKDFIYELKGEREVVDLKGNIELAKELSQTLFDYFDPNSEFLMGQIKIKYNRFARTKEGKPSIIKIGHRVRISDNAKGRPAEQYYVTGVNTAWGFSNSFSQTLRLTRGIIE